MSAGVLAQPSETRIAEPASLSLAPMALSTWDGCTLPEEQTATELTATPARSSAMSWVSAGSPASATREVLGSRGAAAPKTLTYGANHFISLSKRSRTQNRHLNCGKTRSEEGRDKKMGD